MFQKLIRRHFSIPNKLCLVDYDTGICGRNVPLSYKMIDTKRAAADMSKDATEIRVDNIHWF